MIRIGVCIALLGVPIGLLAAVGTQYDPSLIQKGLNSAGRDLRYESTPPKRSESSKKTTIGPGSTGPRFVLRSVILRGKGNARRTAPSGTYESYIGKRVRFGDLKRIAQAMTDYFHTDGYVLNRVIVPPQEVDKGKVRLYLVEGHIKEVRVQGDASARMKQEIRRRLFHLINRPFRYSELERSLLLMQDFHSLDVSSVFRRSKKGQGGVDLVVTADHHPFDMVVNVNDYGGPTYGHTQASVTVHLHDRIQHGDQIQFLYLRSIENPLLVFYRLGYESPIGHSGFEWYVTGHYVRGLPRGSVTALDINGLSLMGQIGLRHAIIRSQRFDWRTHVGLRMLNSESTILGNTLNYRDRIRALEFGTELRYEDPFDGRIRAWTTLSRSLDIFDATRTGTLSRSDYPGYFTKIEYGMSRIQYLGSGWSVYSGLKGQYSPEPLLAGEEIATDGRTYGRGFETSAVVGDEGVLLTLEPRYTLTKVGPMFDLIQSYVFFDHAQTSHVGSTASGSQHVSSIGLGVRAVMAENWSLGFEWAKPLKVHGSEVPNPSLHFNISTFIH